MNCSLCSLPQDTGAMGSVLPQCICHWKHTPYQGTAQQITNETNLEKKYEKRNIELQAKITTLLVRIVELEETINACYAVQKMQAEEVYKGNRRIEELQKDLKYFTDPCNPACRPSICDCYQARFAINNRKASEK